MAAQVWLPILPGLPWSPVSQFPPHSLLGNRLSKCILVYQHPVTHSADCCCFSALPLTSSVSATLSPCSHTSWVPPLLLYSSCALCPVSDLVLCKWTGRCAQCGAGCPGSSPAVTLTMSTWLLIQLGPRQLLCHQISGMESAYFGKQAPESQLGSNWAGSSNLKGSKQTQTSLMESVSADGNSEWRG